jgi:hypothetical protein
MRRRAFLGLFILIACSSRKKDVVSADRCMRVPEEDVRAPSDSELLAWTKRAKFVVRGRVRFSGSVTGNDPQGYRTYRYLIVDTDEFLKGDPFAVHPRYQKSFPLLELTFRTAGPDEEPVPVPEEQSLAALACREEESFVFFVDLPTAESVEASPRVPGPVERAFARYLVPFVAVAPESAKERVIQLR